MCTAEQPGSLKAAVYLLNKVNAVEFEMSMLTQSEN